MRPAITLAACVLLAASEVHPQDLPLKENVLDLRTQPWERQLRSEAETLWLLADCLAKQGKHQAARTRNEEALKALLAQYGDNHPLTGAAYNRVARSIHKGDDASNSFLWFEKGTNLLKKTVGESHPIALQAYSAWADALLDAGQAKEALGLYRKTCVERSQDLVRRIAPANGG